MSLEPLWKLRQAPTHYDKCDHSTGEPCAIACDAEPCNQWLTVKQATAVQPGKLPASPLPNTFLANFSAVCFLTGRDIARMHTKQRPMALIQSAWSGTRVEAWMSKEAIAKAEPSAGAAPPPFSGFRSNNVSGALPTSQPSTPHHSISGRHAKRITLPGADWLCDRLQCCIMRWWRRGTSSAYEPLSGTKVRRTPTSGFRGTTRHSTMPRACSRPLRSL